MVPFGSAGAEGPTVLKVPAGETGLPGDSYLKAHFVSTLPKSRLLSFTRRQFSPSRTREVVNLIRRAFDPDAPYEGARGATSAL
jgi:mRNA-degrading endonuclease toxin of MazEF toxin-antitoxin module